MERDIFEGYIKKLNQVSPKISESLTSVSSQNINSNDTLIVLKEISQKLNKLDFLDKQVSVVENMSTSEIIDIAIINGQVILPDNGIFKLNVYIKNGKIHSLGNGNVIQAKKIVDANGKFVCPGIIDPHVHLGLFASLETELNTETKSAIMGGVTTIGCHFGGVQSHFQSIPNIMESIKENSYVDVVPHLVIGTEEQKNEIFDYVNHLGIRSFKVYLNGIPGLIPDVDDGFVLDVFCEIKKSGGKCILCAHAENRDLIRRANKSIRNEKGENATLVDWTATHPDMAEEEAIIRLSYLAEKSQVPVYFVHISSSAGIKRLRKMKAENKFIHAETTSPYLSNTVENINGVAFKMEPPFRDLEDMEALWQGVEDGTIECIGTDNVTMTMDEKNSQGSMWEAIPGYPALETHLASVLNEGVAKRGVSIEKIITAMTKRPAEIFGIYPRKGSLMPGSDADVVIIDMKAIKEVKAKNLHSRSDFSLFENRTLQGWSVMTIKNGEIVVENGVFTGVAPNGDIIIR